MTNMFSPDVMLRALAQQIAEHVIAKAAAAHDKQLVEVLERTIGGILEASINKAVTSTLGPIVERAVDNALAQRLPILAETVAEEVARRIGFVQPSTAAAAIPHVNKPMAEPDPPQPDITPEQQLAFIDGTHANGNGGVVKAHGRQGETEVRFDGQRWRDADGNEWIDILDIRGGTRAEAYQWLTKHHHGVKRQAIRVGKRELYPRHALEQAMRLRP